MWPMAEKRGSFIWDGTEWVPRHEYKGRAARVRPSSFVLRDNRRSIGGRYVYDYERMRVVRAGKRKKDAARIHNVMSDIEPYRNVAVDGKYVTSRSEHREMLKRHRLIEVGNENIAKGPPKPMSPVELTIKRVMEQKGY